MSVTLVTLELTPQELESCKDAVHKMAYFNWVDAGCPNGNQLEFWLAAEQAWIQRNYVPRRTLDGTRRQPADEPQAASPRKRRQRTTQPRHPQPAVGALLSGS